MYSSLYIQCNIYVSLISLHTFYIIWVGFPYNPQQETSACECEIAFQLSACPMWLNNRTVDSGYSAVHCGNELDRIPHLIFNIEHRESPFSWESFDWNDPSSLYILETLAFLWLVRNFVWPAVSINSQYGDENWQKWSNSASRTTNVYKNEMNNVHPNLWKIEFAQTADQEGLTKRSNEVKKKKWNRKGSKLFKYY